MARRSDERHRTTTRRRLDVQHGDSTIRARMDSRMVGRDNRLRQEPVREVDVAAQADFLSGAWKSARSAPVVCSTSSRFSTTAFAIPSTQSIAREMLADGLDHLEGFAGSGTLLFASLRFCWLILG